MSANTFLYFYLVGTVTSFILIGESYAFNSTHDAWCENNEIISNTMFGPGVVAPSVCRPSQLMYGKKGNVLVGCSYINAGADPAKNFFVCH
jgi:hypothetical protein